MVERIYGVLFPGSLEADRATSRSRPASASIRTASTRRIASWCSARALPAGFPTVTADKEFHQTTFAPNVGIAWDIGRFGVVRGTAGRYYEWLDLGGGDGTSHAPYVVATDVCARNPRTVAPMLNQSLPGAFPLGVDYGLDNKKTYTNEFSAGWEKQLPNASSVGVTFLLKRTLDFQGADDENIIRDPATGALPRPAVPGFRRGAAHLRAELLDPAVPLGPVPLHEELRAGAGASTPTTGTRSTSDRAGVQPDARHAAVPRLHRGRADQRLGVAAAPGARVVVRAAAAAASMFSGFYSFTQGPRSDVTDRRLPAQRDGAARHAQQRPLGGRPVLQPGVSARAASATSTCWPPTTSHLVNLRVQKTFALGDVQRLEFSADVFNLFNSDAAFGFLSADARSANFGSPDQLSSSRGSAQVGARFVF